MSDTKKYYWLKLQNDFFKRNDIRVVEAMPNGKDYIIFYLKLLCESIVNDGVLRFSEEIPYSDEMLSTITSTNIDVVRSAINVFKELKMIEIYDDGTLFMRQVEKMVGSETKWANYKRVSRNQNKEIGQCPTNVQKQIGNCPIEIEIEKDIDIDIDIEEDIDINNNIPSSKPKKVKHKHGEYQNVLLTDEEYNKLHQDYPNANELITYLDEYIEMKGYKAKSHYLAIRKWVVDAVNRDNKKQYKEAQTSNPFLSMLMEEGQQ